jgi:hypothetical protein
MEKKQEIIRIIKKYRDTEYLDTAADEILRLFSVVGRSEQLVCNCDNPKPNDRGYNWCNNCERLLKLQ